MADYPEALHSPVDCSIMDEISGVSSFLCGEVLHGVEKQNHDNCCA